MGTNYYLHQKPDCECCGRPFPAMHIGKSSWGWCFGLHVIPEQGIHILSDWVRLFEQPGAIIRDEYGNELTTPEMLLVITDRHKEDDWGNRNWIGYRNENHFHASNHSERGPNGLLRHRIGSYCVGHGEGTWDYIPGEFS